MKKIDYSKLYTKRSNGRYQATYTDAADVRRFLSGRDLRCVGTILMKERIPLP